MIEDSANDAQSNIQLHGFFWADKTPPKIALVAENPSY